MDHYNIIKRFWDEAPHVDGYKGDHALLFFAVFDLVNRNKWKPKEIGYDQMVERIRLGKKNYLDCRRWLVSNGFLTVVEGRGDYAKARFCMGDAVLLSTAKDTGGDTAEDTSPEAEQPDAVPDEVPDRTADNTADRTHLKEDSKTEDSKTNKQQQSADESAVDGDDVDKAAELKAFLAKKQLELDAAAAGQKPSPGCAPPLPTTEEVRTTLRDSSAHRRYAVERLKVAKGDEEYFELIEKWIDQQETAVAEGEPAYGPMEEVRKHFRNWLPFQNSLNKSSKSNGNANKTTATPGRVEPVQGQKFGSWTGNKFRKPDDDGRKAG